MSYIKTSKQYEIEMIKRFESYIPDFTYGFKQRKPQKIQNISKNKKPQINKSDLYAT
jgi:hypothetical protein